MMKDQTTPSVIQRVFFFPGDMRGSLNPSAQFCAHGISQASPYFIVVLLMVSLFCGCDWRRRRASVFYLCAPGAVPYYILYTSFKSAHMCVDQFTNPKHETSLKKKEESKKWIYRCA